MPLVNVSFTDIQAIDSVGVPPLPIPNREVKPNSADGTAKICGRVGHRRFFRKSSNILWDSFFYLRVLRTSAAQLKIYSRFIHLCRGAPMCAPNHCAVLSSGQTHVCAQNTGNEKRADTPVCPYIVCLSVLVFISSVTALCLCHLLFVRGGVLYIWWVSRFFCFGRTHRCAQNILLFLYCCVLLPLRQTLNH